MIRGIDTKAAVLPLPTLPSSLPPCLQAWKLPPACTPVVVFGDAAWRLNLGWQQLLGIVSLVWFSFPSVTPMADIGGIWD